MTNIVKFKYKNHRSEITNRTVKFIGLMFNHQVGYGYQPGWFLHGICQDKQQPRSFALSNIILPEGVKHYIIEP